MIPIKLLISLFVLYGCQNALGHRSCNGCILLRDCPEASNSSITKKREAFCGIDVVDGVRLPKICCSDFINLNIRIQETNIETHENIALLPEQCGSIDGDRIVGGVFPNIYELPWMTLISYVIGKDKKGRKKYQFKCGGSVINSRYILTAAHCVQNKTIAGVRVGDFNINSKVDCQGEYPYRICETHIQDIKVTKKIVHKDYSTTPYAQNDIALLRVKKPVDFSYKNVKPICLPIYESLRNITLGGKRATVSGWGLTEFNRESPILRKVDIPIKTDDECRGHYDKNAEALNIMDNKFCAGEEGKDSCMGDSGGPLMLEEEYNGFYRNVQFGVVSFGPQQCGSITPGVYTDVRKYMKWILDNIEE